jgi:AraC-like DNA-binding protein
MNERLVLSESRPLRARFFDYERFTYPWHFHSEYEIIYIKEGTGMRFVGNNTDKYGPGDVLLIGSNLPHYMKSDDDVRLSGDCTLRVKGTIVQFEKGFMCPSINNYPQFIKIKHLLEESQNGLYLNTGSSSRLADLLDAIPVETGVDQITSFLQLLKEMSEVTSRQAISASSTSGVVNGAPCDASRIDKIISYLNKHYTRRIGLDEIASFAAMNPAAFCRFFKSKTGKSLKTYLSDMRIAYACKLLLLESDRNIMQISAECGFDTVSYFNKIFKKNTGYTPTQYKAMML